MMKKEKLFLSNKDMPEDLYEKRIHKIIYIQHPIWQYVVFVPVILVLLGCSLFCFELVWWKVVLSLLGGLAFWSVFEYLTHRFFFHANPRWAWLRRLLYSIHWAHHDYPNDSRIMLVNPIISLFPAASLYLLFYLLLGMVYTNFFMVGLLGIYLLYDWFHYASHNENYKNVWFQKMKRHHMRHHYQDAKMNYGFTTDVWDKVVGTDLNIE